MLLLIKFMSCTALLPLLLLAYSYSIPAVPLSALSRRPTSHTTSHHSDSARSTTRERSLSLATEQSFPIHGAADTRHALTPHSRHVGAACSCHLSLVRSYLSSPPTATTNEHQRGSTSLCQRSSITVLSARTSCHTRLTLHPPNRLHPCIAPASSSLHTHRPGSLLSRLVPRSCHAHTRLLSLLSQVSDPCAVLQAQHLLSVSLLPR